MAVGKEQQKERAKEEKLKKEKAEKHEAALLKKEPSVGDAMMAMLEKREQERKMREFIQRLMMANRPFLSSPKTDFSGEKATLEGKFDIGVGSMQGWRSNMEDAHIVDLSLGNGVGLFSVFDGHAGEQCAKQSKILVPALVRKHSNGDETYANVNFTEAYYELDSVLRGKLQDDSGCTACTVLVTDKAVTCANVGDSRAVLCRGRTAIDLSVDHKPETDEERVRIEAAGGKVENNRVNGQLAMSRAIGDYSYKQQSERKVDEQLVIPTPDVVTQQRTAEDRFVVVACDGIFDVLSNQELVDLINTELDRDPKQPLENICETICKTCLAPPAPEGGQPSRPAGTDNMTIVIVKLL
eukprot:CAMPEP_0176431492 /NCGR_PEP_ID=MMETSP0127-20121128/14844_1 /TAXON_ID=938130 /ORGANISM="Platyophrya macrostoma, Strain WH" /LENGTH=353 /DNA_ID=CAMNT_0017813509 /DNA_START=219 /DNA_END=1280 /DNA_ORIENTATION=+